MKKFFTSLLFSLAFIANVFAQDVTSPYYGALTFDFNGDSRTADILASPSCGLNCGTQGTNWFVQANALAGSRYQIGVIQASSGCRSDQYLSPDNLRPMVTSKSQWAVIGYPAINDLGGAGAGCAIPGAASTAAGLPYTNINGVLVTASNVANVVTANLLGGVRQLAGAGKKVILLREPGNTQINNNAVTVASFTGSTSTFTLTVSTVASGVIYTPQTVTLGQIIPGTPGLRSASVPNPGTQQLAGSGVSAGTNIVAQLTGTDGSACPDLTTGTAQQIAASTCTGGVGTYAINISQNIASQAFTGTYSTIAALYDLNANIDAIGAAFPGSVYVVNNNPALWNFTGSATAVTFRAGVLIDGITHFGMLGGYYGGVSFNSAFQSIVPGTDIALANINDVSTANLREFNANPLFQTATGGVNQTCTLSSGTVPAGWTENCGQASTSVTITQGADTNQLYGSAAVPIAGNAVTFAITSTGADLFRLFANSPATAAFNLTDRLQGTMIVNVASGSSRCAVYQGVDFATDFGTVTGWSTYGGASPSGGGFNDGPATAYTYTLRTMPVPPAIGSVTKSFVRQGLYVKLTAAGSCTVTISRASFVRARVYNPATGGFSG